MNRADMQNTGPVLQGFVNYFQAIFFKNLLKMGQKAYFLIKNCLQDF